MMANPMLVGRFRGSKLRMLTVTLMGIALLLCATGSFPIGPPAPWPQLAALLWWAGLLCRSARRLFPLLLVGYALHPAAEDFFLFVLLGAVAFLPWRNLITPLTVYYDDTCAFCRSSVTILQKADWRDLLTFSPSSQLDPADLPHPELGRPNALMATDANGQYAGADAVFYALLRTPGLRLVGALGLLPGILHVSRVVYAEISRRRHCASDVCPAPLPVQQYDLRA